MSWEDAIQAAKNDPNFDLSKLTPEDAAKLFKSTISDAQIDNLVTSIRAATQANVNNAQKLANVMAIVQTVVAVGRILV